MDEELIKKEFNENGMTPYEISMKYQLDISVVYRILKSETGDNAEEGSF